MKSQQLKILAIAISALIVGTTIVYLIDDQDSQNLDSEYVSYDLLNFASYNDFHLFLQNNSNGAIAPTLGGEHESTVRLDTMDAGTNEEKSLSIDDGGYSGTNIQEIGVDEPDIVKTDGTYLYIVSNVSVFIIEAYPANNASIVSTITLNETQMPQDLFVSDNKLAIITQTYASDDMVMKSYEEWDEDDEVMEEDPIDYSGATDLEKSDPIVDAYHPDIWIDTSTTEILIYDISSKTSPASVRTVQMEGYYSTARLIDEYMYVITTYYAYEPVLYSEDEASSYIPKIRVDGIEETIGLSHIYYIDSPDKSSTMTYIASINLLDETEEVASEVYMIGTPSIVYVSSDAIYIASQWYNYDYTVIDEVMEEYVIPALPKEAKDEFELVKTLSLEEYQKSTVSEWILYHYIGELDEKEKQEIAKQIVLQYEKTIIHKITVNDGVIDYAAQGTVPGYIQNQFSLGEYEGNLRVATTVNGWMVKSYVSSIESYNNVYVLNEALAVIGSVEDIATGESIYSVRFMDDICYVVTYKEIDPFFVIDVSDPYDPVILGKLKIPGYSTYLHPYDDDHIIGIGMENSSIKINLFNVEDISNPVALDTYVFEQEDDEYYWMYSSALYNHKAFLFDKEKNLLILPVSTDYIESAYVFDISVEGIELQGVISHTPDDVNPDTVGREDVYWKDMYRYGIQRSLFIGDVIYTISDAMIQMNTLNGLDEINGITLI